MTRAPFVLGKASEAFSRQRRDLRHDARLALRQSADEGALGVDSMAETAENVAERIQGIARGPGRLRAAQQQRAAAAQRAAGSRARSSPVDDQATARAAIALVDRDEHPRATTLEELAELPTPFRKGGTVTAGNARASTTARRRCSSPRAQRSKRHGLQPLARVARPRDGRRARRASWASARCPRREAAGAARA